MRTSNTTELDLTPLMNIFTVLIPMLLLSVAFIQVRAIEMSLPAASQQDPEPAEDELELTVRVTRDAYVVEGHAIGSRSIARSGDVKDAGRVQLAEVLAQVAAQFPSNRDVRIVAQPTTHYDEIVVVMDVARAAGMPQAALVSAARGAS